METKELVKGIQRLIQDERAYLEKLRGNAARGSEIDYAMGKIRAFERVLLLIPSGEK